MAAPFVAGSAAVLRQFLREERQMASPSAALLKAILIAATRRLPSLRGPGDRVVGFPDFDQGFGRLDLSCVLPSIATPKNQKLLLVDVANNSAQALESRMPIGNPRQSFRTYRFQIAPPAGAGPPAGAASPDSADLCLVLVWTDVSGNGLQNTLSLTLRKPDGNSVLGNPEQFFHRDEFDDSPYDKRNNVQQIRIPKPDAGDYLIRIGAQNTVAPPQGYALCVCGPISSDLDEQV